MLEVLGLKVSFSSILLGLICIGTGLFFLYGTWGAYAEYKRVQDYSGRSIGHITSKHSKLASDGGGNYNIDYWFMASSGKKISAASIIAKQQWDMLQVGDTLEIRFNPFDPTHNIPMYGGSPSLVFAFFVFILGAVFMLFGSLRVVYGFRKLPQAKSLKN
jgi:hypothetical protein